MLSQELRVNSFFLQPEDPAASAIRTAALAAHARRIQNRDLVVIVSFHHARPRGVSL
jgi:hypothetical protein